MGRRKLWLTFSALLLLTGPCVPIESPQDLDDASTTLQLDQLPVLTENPKDVTQEANPETDNAYADENENAEVNEEEQKGSSEDYKSKQTEILKEALDTILDPTTQIQETENEILNKTLIELASGAYNLTEFISRMDSLSLDVCKESQAALWNYVTDSRNEWKRNEMTNIVAREDEIKMQYWRIMKEKYLSDPLLNTDPDLQRRIRLIRERGTNVQMPQSKQREEIDSMQRIWTQATVCAYNTSICSQENLRRLTDIMEIFKTSNNSKELLYYWKGFRDATGRVILPIFKDYVGRVNKVAQSELFPDAGAMWRYNFEDDFFIETVDRLWNEVKPLYNLLRKYIRRKLGTYYKIDSRIQTIPAHLTGNLWAQEWQSLYFKVAPYPDEVLPVLSDYSSLTPRDVLDAADSTWTRLGFESARASYVDSTNDPPPANCLPSSHDLCDGHNFRVRWCGDLGRGSLSRASRLLGHIYYFKQYKDQPVVYRDGPTPAFHDTISEVMSLQTSSPLNLKEKLPTPNNLDKSHVNYLMWIALEKLPLLAYSYALDKWRWTIFANSSLDNWNKLWWEIRESETGISAPLLRDESDLDPASKYHVVSHVQYITYFISHIMEFQILRALCKIVGHTGPLSNCTIDSSQEAGDKLRAGMSIGASQSWRIVLKSITGESDISTKGILEYFEPLQTFLENETKNQESPIALTLGILGIIALSLMLILYINLKCDIFRRIMGSCKGGRNGSLEIATTNCHIGKVNEAVDVREQGV